MRKGQVRVGYFDGRDRPLRHLCSNGAIWRRSEKTDFSISRKIKVYLAYTRITQHLWLGLWRKKSREEIFISTPSLKEVPGEIFSFCGAAVLFSSSFVRRRRRVLRSVYTQQRNEDSLTDFVRLYHCSFPTDSGVPSSRH